MSPTRAGSDAPLLVEDVIQEETVIPETQYSDHTPLKPIRALSLINNLGVLVPNSSPLERDSSSRRSRPGTSQLCNATSSDSIDSIEDEEIVTPSYEPSYKRKTSLSSTKARPSGIRSISTPTMLGKRKSEEQQLDDEEEAKRAEKAKIVASSWRNKFAYKEVSSSSPGIL